MCNQLRNPWQFLYSEHTGRQPVILHVPFVTDASTSPLQHVWPYCTRTQHWIVHKVLGLSKHDDGEISNKYQSSCQDDMLSLWVIGLWGRSVWELRVLSVTASAGFDPTHGSDLTQLFSIMACLTATSIWVKKKNKQKMRNFLSGNSISESRIFKCSHFWALSWQTTFGGCVNTDCPFQEAKADVARCGSTFLPMGPHGPVKHSDKPPTVFLSSSSGNCGELRHGGDVYFQ